MHEDYRVVDSEMNVYDSIHLEFANGCHIYDDYSDLKDVLFYKFAFQTFVEDVRCQADIVDEPEGCTDFYTFRALLYERYNWDQMMKHYFKKYVLPHMQTLHLPKLSLYFDRSFWQRSMFSQDRLATELANQKH